ncbi:twin-arginine translocase subunit TatC [Natronorubrum halophilum]|uniref:twin-arginine translocase subunit TatC n=1 Tax=Natronorubrum halophilum TaxID=1702106 RepID=UPI000EF6A18C|nr:twin-arginine translocase subunit TatC [Natronorubrum halophilum]
MSDEPLDGGTDEDPVDELEEPQGTPEERLPTDDGENDPDAVPPVETDGEGVVGDHHEPGGESAYPDPDDDIGGISTPPDDEEMPLADHIEEMILRLAVVLLFGSAGTALGLLFASDALEYIWLNVFPYAEGEVPPPHVYHPLELWLTRIKLSALLGIMVALPMFVYQCYRFMKPGLYPNERKYYLAAVPMSVVLAAGGMLFSYILVLPVLFQYFTFYAEGSANIAYALGDTFNLIITLTGFLAIVFQIPLFIMLAIMMGVTTRRWLAQKRLYFWAAFAGLSFMFTMDPTMMAPILVAVTMILLFEGTLLILKWVGRE